MHLWAVCKEDHHDPHVQQNHVRDHDQSCLWPWFGHAGVLAAVHHRHPDKHACTGTERTRPPPNTTPKLDKETKTFKKTFNKEQRGEGEGAEGSVPQGIGAGRRRAGC